MRVVAGSRVGPCDDTRKAHVASIIVMAFIIMAYILMAYILMACIVVVYMLMYSQELGYGGRSLRSESPRLRADLRKEEPTHEPVGA